MKRPKGHEAAKAEIAKHVRAVEIICDEFGYDPTEWLADETTAELSSVPQAWLFHCWKAGEHVVFASVDKNTSEWWPKDQWRGVSRIPLGNCGEPELLHGVPPPSWKGAGKPGELTPQ